MMLQGFSLLMIFHTTSGDTKITNSSKITDGRIMGLDIASAHDLKINKIDKDTVITRLANNNLKISKRRKSASKTEEKNPDWSYSSFPEDVKDHVVDFKRNMSECLKEVQASDTRQIKRLSPQKESPVHGECLIACVLKRNGVISHGKVHKGNLLTLVRKFYAKDEKLIKKLEKKLDRCIEVSVRGKDDCAIAARLNECTNDLMANNKHKITVKY